MKGTGRAPLPVTVPRATAYQNCKGPQSLLILQLKKKQTHEGKEVHGRNRTKTQISSPDLFPLLSRPPGFGPFPSIERSAFVPGELWGKKTNQNKVKFTWQLEKWACEVFTLLSVVLIPRFPSGGSPTSPSQALVFISLPALGVGM